MYAHMYVCVCLCDIRLLNKMCPRCPLYIRERERSKIEEIVFTDRKRHGLSNHRILYCLLYSLFNASTIGVVLPLSI